MWVGILIMNKAQKPNQIMVGGGHLNHNYNDRPDRPQTTNLLKIPTYVFKKFKAMILILKNRK